MIAVISGTGLMPVQACKILRENNSDFFVISLFPEDNFSEIEKATNENSEVIAEKFYKPSQILEILKAKKAKKLLFIGKVDKKNLLKKVRFDWLGAKLMASLACNSDQTIMERLVRECEHRGFEVIKQNAILDLLRVEKGIIAGTATPYILENIDFGIKAAKQMSLMDIGQTVVVKDKMILAVEAIEGTDKCIERGIKLGHSGVIVCKAASDQQNKKFDLPTLGPKSIENIQPGQILAIAWDSSTSLIVDQANFKKKAVELEITLLSV
jgi:UDP-2,3-diacylglucosamine hydrolase